MSAPTCVRCGRPTADGYACMGCANRTRGQLVEICETAPAARDIAQGQGSHNDGGASGKPGSRLPLDLGATARLDAVEGKLGTWLRHVAEERGLTSSDVSHWHEPIEGIATQLGNHLEWMRHRPEIDEFMGDVEACARVVRGIARGPSEQKYLGPCGATVTWDDGGSEVPRETPCEGDVYAWPGATDGTCRECKARWLTAKRRAWIEEQTAELAAPARDIAHALDLSVKTIRSWATEIVSETGYVVRKVKLKTYWRTGEHVVPWTERPDGMSDEVWAAEVRQRGPRLHYVGDVRDLAREAAVRRAESEARRARMEATREDAA